MKKIFKSFLLTIRIISFIILFAPPHVMAQQVTGCFASDPGMGSTNRNDHYNWAQGHAASELQENLEAKIDILYSCPSINDNAFAAAFADYSVIIAQFAQKANCIKNDPGAMSTTRATHSNWAKTKSRLQLLENLQWKAAVVFTCLDSREQKTFFVALSVVIAQTTPATIITKNPGGNKDAPGEWKVWVKTSPCSGRFDWISVAKQNPSGAGNFYFLVDHIISGTGCTTTGCTFERAMEVANSVRTSPRFANYCCRDYSVWENTQTGKMSVVLGKFGTAGSGWQLVKSDLCCEEAEALAGIPGACSGATDNPGVITDIKCPPGSYKVRNSQTKKLECLCNWGLVWNSTKTACVPEEKKHTDCSGFPGSIAAWNEQTKQMECRCPEGKQWNYTKTACIDKREKVNCPPGSFGSYNSDTKETTCYCEPYLVWNSTKTACVEPAELVKNTDCSKYPGSYAKWNEQTKIVECVCPAGKKWNGTACVDDVGVCWPGSYAAINPQTNKTECLCNPGLVWNSTKTACVPETKKDPGTKNTCTDADNAAFAKIMGTWKAYRMHVNIGGSCDNVTGTWKVTEWCEGVDATNNPSVARINGTFKGKMQSGSLQVEWQHPPSPNNNKGAKGVGSISLQSDGTLSVSWGCGGNLNR